MPVLSVGPTSRQGALEVPLAEPHVLGPEPGDDGRDDRAVERVQLEVAELERPAIASASSSAVESPRVAKRQSPTQLGAVEDPDVGLGVADVDRKQHARMIARTKSSVAAARPG